MTVGVGEPLRVQLLGPLRAWRGDAELELGAPRQRAVLGMLAVRPNQSMPRNELIDAVWGENPPATAANNVHIYVAGLRRVLEPHRTRRAPGQVLRVDGSGYLLRLESDHVDAQVFDHELGQARRNIAAGELAVAVRSFDRALRLWRATPLGGIPGPGPEMERVRLSEAHLTAVEERAEVVLTLGGHAQIAAELAVLVRQHPLRERLRGQLMLALYRCGRRAEALRVYADTRRVLVAELGLEPCPDLRRRHEQILTADPALDAPAAGLTATAGFPISAGSAAVADLSGTGGFPVRAGSAAAANLSGTGGFPVGVGRTRRTPDAIPRELPADVSAFTGRAAELAELDRLLAATSGPAGGAGARSTAVLISAVSGTGGVGKTALAVRWAHRVRDRFPDGQLYVNLRGYDPEQPMPAAAALAGFLGALGMAGEDIPLELEDRAACYRTLLDGRRVLVVLDNAASTEQVRPLLPGSSSCLVVVTSRDRLAGLVARHGARRLDLDLLPAPDAVALLRALIGDRVDAEPEPAATLADQCVRLPLALRVAAELAAGRPGTPLARLVQELTDQHRRLDLLDAGGDRRTAVRAVFSWSYQHLPAAAARAFRLLGLHPGLELDDYAAAALTGTPAEQAQRLLTDLAGAHLIHQRGRGRYGMHDLLRAYAAGLAAGADGADAQAALGRLFDYYLATAATAMDVLVPAERHRRPAIQPPGVSLPPIVDAAAARGWLDSERAALVTVAGHTAAHGWPRHTIRLAATVSRYLDTGGHYLDALCVHSAALTAARHSGDRAAEAHTLTSLGSVDYRQGRYQRAAEHYQQALTLAAEVGDRLSTVRARNSLGTVRWRQGRYQQAAGQFEQALALSRQIGDRSGEARSLSNLGTVCWRQGRYRSAAEHYQQALALSRQIGHRDGEAHALVNLGLLDERQGSHQQAVDHLERAIALSGEIGHRDRQAHGLLNLGGIYQRRGYHRSANDLQQRALLLFREIGDGDGEAEALNGIGETLLAAGRPEAARTQHAAALGLASQSGERYQQACAHDGLANAHAATGDRDQARRHWQHALACYTSLGVPDAARVRARLADLGLAVGGARSAWPSRRADGPGRTDAGSAAAGGGPTGGRSRG